MGGESWFDIFIRAKSVLDVLLEKYVKKDFKPDKLEDTKGFEDDNKKDSNNTMTTMNNSKSININTKSNKTEEVSSSFYRSPSIIVIK